MKPIVIFVTDPLCSWCWAMLPDMEKLRVDMADWLDFDLMVAGLQVGGPEPPTPQQVQQLKSIWLDVANTTGQMFSGALPDDPSFIYHSEMACRAVEIMRTHLQQPPWDYFRTIQQAFYLESCNINDPAQLTRLAEPFGMKGNTLAKLLESDAVIEATRSEFARAKQLGAVALPSILIDFGAGPKLVSGGWVSAEFLRPDLEARVQHEHGPSH